MCICAFGASAQLSNVSAKFGSGITFRSLDSTFTLRFNGRIQSLFQAADRINSDLQGADFLLRRSRLNFQGTAINSRFTYRIQIGFAHGDITSGNSQVENNLILRDAMINYQLKPWFRIGFGQTKLPGNRQRVYSSGTLQLVERSMANNNFTLDRDKGIWFYNGFNLGKSHFKNTFAISSGEGRIISNSNGRLCYTLRSEFLPFGQFTNNGDYSEADLEKEETPKLSFAAVYSYNHAANRTMGQLGEYLYNNQVANIAYYGGDLLFKYKGFSFESEIYNRNSNSAIIVNDQDGRLSNFVVSGKSFLVQSGYLFTKSDEIALRFGSISPLKKVSPVMLGQKEYVIGYSHYFMKHSLKIQNDISYFSFSNGQRSVIFRISSVCTF
jgi:hypothetical protein